MKNNYIVLILLLVSSCSWVSIDYWQVRSVVKNYHKEIYALNTKKATFFLTKKSSVEIKDKLTKYTKQELSNYKKLSAYSSFKFTNIEIKGNEANVSIIEKVPDFELIFGTVISLHLNKSNQGTSEISLETLINRFIDEVISEDPSLFLESQEMSYLLVKEDNEWKIKLE
jgi:hypothetical protein